MRGRFRLQLGNRHREATSSWKPPSPPFLTPERSFQWRERAGPAALFIHITVEGLLVVGAGGGSLGW